MFTLGKKYEQFIPFAKLGMRCLLATAIGLTLTGYGLLKMMDTVKANKSKLEEYQERISGEKKNVI